MDLGVLASSDKKQVLEDLKSYYIENKKVKSHILCIVIEKPMPEFFGLVKKYFELDPKDNNETLLKITYERVIKRLIKEGEKI